MAKKTPIKSGGTTAGRYNTGGQSTGGNALVSQHRVAKDGMGQIKGTSIARHHTVKPSGDSGTVGAGTALKTNSGYKEPRNSDTPLSKVHRSTKPNK